MRSDQPGNRPRAKPRPGGTTSTTAELQAANAVVEWPGASGAKYAYWAYELPEVPDQAAIGSYVFARRDADGQWVPIFFGHGDLATLGEGVHALWTGLRAKGATHVHTHRNARVKSRISEEADLLAAHPIAYAPEGCNPLPDLDGDAREPGPKVAKDKDAKSRDAGT